MRLLASALLLGSAACADPAIDMKLVVPTDAVAASFDTSCVGAVQVYVDGKNYPTPDITDYKQACIPITTNPATFADLAAELQGKFDVAIPDSGLMGIEIYGFGGDCDQVENPPDGAPEPDLSFFGSMPYIGQDEIDLTMVPNVSCTHAPVTVDLVDMLALNATKQCASATVTDSGAGADLGTLSPNQLMAGVNYYGSNGAASTNSVAAFSGATTIGSEDCLAASAGSSATDGVSCVSTTGSTVCATGGQIEVPVINYTVAMASTDPNNIQNFGGVLFGTVWGTVGTVKQPITGATISLADPNAKGTIVYFDQPAGVETGTGSLTLRAGATSTDASGMFGLYANEIVDVTVTANGKTKTVRMAATASDPAAALVDMD